MAFTLKFPNAPGLILGITKNLLHMKLTVIDAAYWGKVDRKVDKVNQAYLVQASGMQVPQKSCQSCSVYIEKPQYLFQAPTG